jgi:hypothetical protein
VQRPNLTSAVEQLAWTTARETLNHDADQQEHWLAALRCLLAIRDSAEQLAASAALSAAEHGADYPAIGAAAGMTRQGARRKWPGLAGLSESRYRKSTWWDAHGREFEACVAAVLAVAGELPWSATLRSRLGEMPGAFDHVMVDAHAVAMGASTPVDPEAARSIGRLAALTADAYAATNGHSALVGRGAKACGTAGCPAEPVVELLGGDHAAVPACRGHAVVGLRAPGNRIVAAYEPEVALALFAEAHSG